ncbi:MAG: AraC family transcriptional regulator [Porcipelethomonas sp.]
MTKKGVPMSNLSDLFNGNYIHIDNTVSDEALREIMYIKHAGYFTQDSCPPARTQGSSGLFFMIVLNGSGVVEYNGTLHNAAKGQCVFLDCSLPHYYMPNEEDPWEVIWINFGGPASGYYYSRFTQKRCCVFIPQNSDNIQVIMEKIINNNLHKSEDAELINSKLVTDLLVAIITNYCIYEDECTSKFRHKLFYVRDYLDNNFTKPINLDDLAGRFFISKFYLTREFKKEFKTTIIQYTLKKRIDYAKELLIHTNKSVEEISEACGFNDQSYFSRQFKKAENTTCLAYRKNNS